MTGDEKRVTGEGERGSPLDTRHSQLVTPLRFPKSARLTRVSEFRHVKEEGESFHGRFIVLSVLKHPESSGQKAEATRIGFITSRRVGGAVVRNRVRRRLREIVRVSRPALREGFWLVLIARSRAAEASFQSLQRDWITLARRAGILNEEAIA